MNKFKNDPFEVAPPRKRKGRGAVANVFYDSQQNSQQSTLAHDALGGGMDMNYTGQVNGKNGKIFGAKGLPTMTVGGIDMLLNPDEQVECCQACNSSNYMAPPTATPAQEQDVLWL